MNFKPKKLLFGSMAILLSCTLASCSEADVSTNPTATPSIEAPSVKPSENAKPEVKPSENVKTSENVKPSEEAKPEEDKPEVKPSEDVKPEESKPEVEAPEEKPQEEVILAPNTKEGFTALLEMVVNYEINYSYEEIAYGYRAVMSNDINEGLFLKQTLPIGYNDYYYPGVSSMYVSFKDDEAIVYFEITSEVSDTLKKVFYEYDGRKYIDLDIDYTLIKAKGIEDMFKKESFLPSLFREILASLNGTSDREEKREISFKADGDLGVLDYSNGGYTITTDYKSYIKLQDNENNYTSYLRFNDSNIINEIKAITSRDDIKMLEFEEAYELNEAKMDEASNMLKAYLKEHPELVPEEA